MRHRQAPAKETCPALHSTTHFMPWQRGEGQEQGAGEGAAPPAAGGRHELRSWVPAKPERAAPLPLPSPCAFPSRCFCGSPPCPYSAACRIREPGAAPATRRAALRTKSAAARGARRGCAPYPLSRYFSPKFYNMYINSAKNPPPASPWMNRWGLFICPYLLRSGAETGGRRKWECCSKA